jgi:hypothetical protein
MFSICALALRVTSTQYASDLPAEPSAAAPYMSVSVRQERSVQPSFLAGCVHIHAVSTHTLSTCTYMHAQSCTCTCTAHAHVHAYMHVHVCACSRICRWGLWLASVCLRAVTRESETGRTCVRECGARIHPHTTIPHLREKISRWKRNHASGSALVLVASRSSASASWLLDDKRNWLPTWLAMIS